jgi:GNAT superfamily N-acetyltransferase
MNYKIRLLDKRDEESLKNFLRPNISECMFILGNLKRSGINFEKQQQFYGKYFGSFDKKTNQINGVLVHYWNGNLMMFAFEDQILKDLTRELLHHDQSFPILGILGPEKQSQVILDELKILEFNSDNLDDLLELDLNEIQDCFFENKEDFKIIDPAQMNQDVLFDWMKNYEIEALERKDDESLEQIVWGKIKRLLQGDCYVLTYKNKPVSLTAFNARFEKTAQIGPVWTPKEERSKGFAKYLLKFLIYKSKQDGLEKLILFSDNQIALNLYESMGFKYIGKYRIILI